MKLIHFQGLNCYYNCIVTLANVFGLDYTKAFSRLWAEGYFRYDPICDVFLSRRLLKTLELLGMKLDTPRITKRDRETGWADTPAGHYSIIGMDARLIPWSPLYKLLHGPHYFIVQRGASDSHGCFDPTYGVSDQKLNTQELIFNAYALITVKTCNADIPLINDPFLEQSKEVLKAHPETLRHFLEQADVWMRRSEKTVLLPAKYVEALQTGRYLYRHFLSTRKNAAKRAPLFFSRQYYDDWLTVKNGFYKAALTRHNRAAFDEARRLLAGLFEQELQLARQINPPELKHS